MKALCKKQITNPGTIQTAEEYILGDGSLLKGTIDRDRGNISVPGKRDRVQLYFEVTLTEQYDDYTLPGTGEKMGLVPGTVVTIRPETELIRSIVTTETQSITIRRPTGTTQTYRGFLSSYDNGQVCQMTTRYGDLLTVDTPLGRLEVEDEIYDKDGRLEEVGWENGKEISFLSLRFERAYDIQFLADGTIKVIIVDSHVFRDGQQISKGDKEQGFVKTIHINDKGEVLNPDELLRE